MENSGSNTANAHCTGHFALASKLDQEKDISSKTRGQYLPES